MSNTSKTLSELVDAGNSPPEQPVIVRDAARAVSSAPSLATIGFGATCDCIKLWIVLSISLSAGIHSEIGNSMRLGPFLVRFRPPDDPLLRILHAS